MNAELLRLLAEAGVTGDFGWRDVVVRQSYAPVPRVVAATATEPWHRGFNLVVLSRGVPKFFCKCRPGGDPVLDRETQIRTYLAAARCGGLSVPPARVASSSRIAVQVGPFLRGVHYGHVVTSQSSGAYVKTLRGVLEGAAELWTLAQLGCAGVRGPSASLVLHTAASESLAEVAALGELEPELLAALTAAVRDAGEVPAHPQHGDFWWQNVLMAEGRYWAIDFDLLGDVQVPLYDDLTMMSTTLRLRPGAGDTGFERLLADGAEARGCREVLAEHATTSGLTPSQLDGVLVYQLAHMACSVMRRGVAVHAVPHLAAVRRAAELLASGKRGLLSVR